MIAVIGNDTTNSPITFYRNSSEKGVRDPSQQINQIYLNELFPFEDLIYGGGVYVYTYLGTAGLIFDPNSNTSNLDPTNYHVVAKQQF